MALHTATQNSKKDSKNEEIMTLKRWPKGKPMTPEQRLARKHLLQKEWRKRHPEKVKAQNHKWAVYYQRVRPFVCVCNVCGCEFGAPRNYFVVCQDCIKKRKENRKAQIEARKARAEAKIKRNMEIIRLHKKGLFQRKIAEIVGIKQASVSYVLRSFGYRSKGVKK